MIHESRTLDLFTNGHLILDTRYSILDLDLLGSTR